MKGTPMQPVSEFVEKFFEDFEKGINTSDLELMGSRYAESFMFAGPLGAQPVKKADFLMVLPKRQALMKSLGQTSSTLKSLEETRLDENYLIVKVFWNMRFEKEGAAALVDENSATYILFQQGELLQIVFQLDHQNLVERVQKLGLMSGPQ
jgi:hypothetical protein